MERQIITVDISPHRGMVPQLRVSQGDIGRPLGVYIMQDGAALDCSNYSADLYILKSDGNYYVAPATVDSTETNLIIWSTELQETPVAGECAGQIRITHGEDDIGTARFIEYVEASPGFSGAGSESAVESIKEYVLQAAASAETASSAATSARTSATTATGAASSATSSATAAAGSASSAHTDAETASQAAQTAQDVAASIPADYSQLSDDVTGLKSAIVERSATYTNFFNSSLISEPAIKHNGSELIATNTSFNGIVIPLNCETATQYTVSLEYYCEGNVSTSGRGMYCSWCYSDETYGNSISLSNGTTTFTQMSDTSRANTTITGFRFVSATGTGNIFHIKNIMVAKGTAVQSYVPYYIPKDTYARDQITNIKVELTRIVGNPESLYKKSLMFGKMRLNAHAGLTKTEYVDNSIPAFENAGKKGMWACETDFRKTKDGYIVCMHNASVDATTNGSGNVADMTLAQIRALYLLDVNGNISTEKVPTIDEYLKVCKKYNMNAMPEDKEGNLDIIEPIINKYGMTDNTIIQCNPHLARNYRNAGGTLNICVISANSTWALTQEQLTKGNMMVSYDASEITDTIVNYCHNIGVPIGAYTVNTMVLANSIFDLFVDFITSSFLSPQDFADV